MKQIDPEQYLVAFMEAKQAEFEFESAKLNMMNMVIFQHYELIMKIPINGKLQIELYKTEVEGGLVVNAEVSRTTELQYHVTVTETSTGEGGKQLTRTLRGWLNTVKN